MLLTDTKAAGDERDYKLAGSGGLYLFVTAKGAKVWRQKYRYAGEEKLLAHGPYPGVSLAKACELLIAPTLSRVITRSCH